jgi:hypothetical protein
VNATAQSFVALRIVGNNMFHNIFPLFIIIKKI